MTTWRTAMSCLGMAAIGLSLAGCKDKPTQAAEPPPRPSVDVVTLRARPVTLTTELPGRTSRLSDGGSPAAGERRSSSSACSSRATRCRPASSSTRSIRRHMRPAWPVRRRRCCTRRPSVKTAQSVVSRYRPLAAAFAVSRQDLDNAVGTLEQDRGGRGLGPGRRRDRRNQPGLYQGAVADHRAHRPFLGDRGRAGDRRPGHVAGDGHAA